MSDIFIRRQNHVHAKIECDEGISMELAEEFTYFAEGYMWSPKFKYGQWDGKIREFNRRNNTMRIGLHHKLREWAGKNGYTVEDDGTFGYTEFSVEEAHDFINDLALPHPYNNVRDYQIKGFVGAVRENRCIRILPTASGKSLVIYLLARYYGLKTLIIVPTKGLVSQMASDFEEYGYDRPIHQITGGVTKFGKCDITISTWQSLYKERPDYFDQYEVIIGDEVHLFAANSLTGIMDKARNAAYRFGFTGTLNGSKTNETCLTGMFGKVHKVVSTAELIEQKHIAELKIKIILLKYSEAVRNTLKKMTYQKEISWLISYPPRNRFIRNLALSLKGNTLILFTIVDHGKYLHEIITKKAEEGRNVYFIAGETDVDDREIIRKILETEDNAIVVASKGTTSTGSNTKKLHNIIFVHPSKSKIQNLQSIGRGLRKTEGKESATLYDLGDDLHYKSWKNHTLNHLMERVKIYIQEKFPYKIYEIDLKE